MLLQVDGYEAYCYTGGRTPQGDGRPAAVFIHGAQNDHSVWALQSRYFAHHGFDVLAPDLPGHGRSKGAALASIEALADWLLALMDAAGVTEATLIGHSMGSLIGLETARRAPSRVRRLALLGTAYPMKVSKTLLDAALNDEQSAIDTVNIWSHSSVAQKPSFAVPGLYAPGGARRLMQRVAQRNPAHVLHTDFSACDAYAGGEAAAAAISCPTLFMIGKRDVMTPSKATALLASLLPHASTVRVDSGHAMMAEQPDAVLDALFGFATTATKGTDPMGSVPGYDCH